MRREPPFGLGRQRRMIEPQRMADQDARVELRRVEAGVAEALGKLAPRRRNGAARSGGRHHDNSAASSSA